MPIKPDHLNTIRALQNRLNELVTQNTPLSAVGAGVLDDALSAISQINAERRALARPSSIRSMKDLQDFIQEGIEDFSVLGRVDVTIDGDLIQFNPRRVEDPNWFERLPRGIIFNRRTLRCMAYPFDRFRDYEPGAAEPETALRLIMPYIESGIGGFAYYDSGVQNIVVGRAGMMIDNTLTEWLRLHHRRVSSMMLSGYTTMLHFEKDHSDAIDSCTVLAVRGNLNGQFLPPKDVQRLANAWNLKPVLILSSSTAATLAEKAEDPDYLYNGFVARDEQGQYWKIKPEAQRISV